MEGKDLLNNFKTLPVDEQTKILVDAYRQIDAIHSTGRSYKSFDWRNCRLENGVLTIDAEVEEVFGADELHKNLTDYAGVIYCLAVGNKSAESMGWDGGRKIKSPVLREIVLTICGRNESVDPLINKLRQSYVDEDTFFEGYTTVDEKEGREAYEKKKKIDEENKDQEAENYNREFFTEIAHKNNKKPWGERIGIFILMVLCFGGYKLYKSQQTIKKQQTIEQIQRQNEQIRQRREIIRDIHVDIPFRANKVDSIDKLIKSTEETINKNRETLKRIRTTTENAHQLREKHDKLQQSIQHLKELQKTRDQLLQQHNSETTSEDLN